MSLIRLTNITDAHYNHVFCKDTTFPNETGTKNVAAFTEIRFSEKQTRVHKAFAFMVQQKELHVQNYIGYHNPLLSSEGNICSYRLVINILHVFL